MEKLNLNFKNKTNPLTVSDPKINAENLNKMTFKIDELIDFSSKTINAGDFNEAIKTGFYIMQSGCANSPLGSSANKDSHFYLITIQFGNSNFCVQLSTTITQTNMNLYQRKLYNGTWGNWQIL